MRRRIKWVVLASLVLAGACARHHQIEPEAAAALPAAAWAEFSLRSAKARRITDTTVQVGRLPFSETALGSEHWLRKTTKSFGGGTQVQLTDTPSCPAAQIILAEMLTLEMPRPIGDGMIEVIADGIHYSLSVDARFRDGRNAQIAIRSTGGTPLANWADRALQELEPCWSSSRPDAAG